MSLPCPECGYVLSDQEYYILDLGEVALPQHLLDRFEEKLEDLTHRAKYYEELPTKETLQDLLTELKFIRLGEAP